MVQATIGEPVRAPWSRLADGVAAMPDGRAGYVWAAVLVGCGLAVRLLLVGSYSFAMLTFYPLIVLSAVLFGAGPGLLALGIAEFVIATVFFPHDPNVAHGRHGAVALTVFAGSAGALCLVIGRLRAAQLRLLAVEQKLHHLLAGAHVGIAQVDSSGTVLEANGAFSAITGYRVRQRLAGDGRPGDGDTEFACADGTGVPVHLHRIRFWLNGDIHDWLLIDDLRERRESEARLGRLLREQRAVIENPQVGIALQHGSRIVWANPAMARMFGYTQEEFTQLSSNDLYWSRQARDLTVRDAAEVCGRGEVYHGLVKGRRKDGSSCWVEFTSAYAADAADNEWVVTATDVSERRRIDREVIDAANRERAKLGYDLHDGLGQELTGMSLLVGGLADLVRRGEAVQLAQIERLEAVAARATATCRGIARGLSPVGDLGTSLVSALADFAEVQARTYDLDVRFVPVLHAPLRLSSDGQDQMFRIAQEAVANARRHAEARAIGIGLEVEADTVRLTISDDGKGLPANARHGNGLGLKVMRRRAERIGGSLLIAPGPTGGTVVTCQCFQIL